MGNKPGRQSCFIEKTGRLTHKNVNNVNNEQSPNVKENHFQFHTKNQKIKDTIVNSFKTPKKLVKNPQFSSPSRENFSYEKPKRLSHKSINNQTREIKREEILMSPKIR